MKMYLFRKARTEKQNKSEIDKLERFTVFCCFFYTEHWFLTPFASEASYSDLKLYQDMIEFRKHDDRMANAVLEKFLRHTWYLNQQIIPFALFSKNVSDEEKSEMALKLSQEEPPEEGFQPGCPNLVDLTLYGDNPKLIDFIQGGSLFIFDALNINKDWLVKPISEWKNYESFCEMKSFVENLLVTNDTAERGIKLVSDYIQSQTTCDETLQELLQVVEQHRKEFPDVKKSTLRKKSK